MGAVQQQEEEVKEVHKLSDCRSFLIWVMYDNELETAWLSHHHDEARGALSFALYSMY